MMFTKHFQSLKKTGAKCVKVGNVIQASIDLMAQIQGKHMHLHWEKHFYFLLKWDDLLWRLSRKMLKVILCCLLVEIQ